MKKSLIVVMLIFVLFLSGCGNKKDFTLTIKESSWSGWVEDYIPDEVTKDYEVEKGKEYNIDSGNLVFTIEEINDDNIVIKTKDYFYAEGEETTTNEKKFTIYLDKELVLVTPTMDAGYIYYFNLKSK